MNYTNAIRDDKRNCILGTPDDHLKLMTQGITRNPHGTVLVGWKPLKTPKWFKAGLEEGQDQLSRFTNEPDIYLTPNYFHNWRLIRLLKGLNAFFIDLDDHENEKPDLVWMFSRAQIILHERGWPPPNAVIYSGRGIHLYWLLENTPPQALPRWKAVQKTLCAALGGDIHAVDPTRLLRVIGTLNSKTGYKVTGEQFFDTRYDFNEFCDTVLPYKQAEVRDFKAAQARLNQNKGKSKKAVKKSPQGRSGSIYDRWYLVYQDLLKIQNHFWFGGMQDAGHRDLMLFHTANALSWFTRSDALINEIKATAKIMTPSLSLSDAMSYCSSVVRRAKQSASDSEERRYRYRRETLWRAFEPVIGHEPELVQQLRAIIPDELAKEREAERQSNRDRVAEGRWAKHRTKSDEIAKLKRRVRRMVSQGHPTSYIAERLDLTPRRVNQIKKSLNQKNKYEVSNDGGCSAKKRK